MANLTVTAADVRPLEGAIVRRYSAGDTVYVGDCVYMGTAGAVLQAAAGTSTIGSAIPLGIVVSAPDGGTVAVSGDKVDVVVYGPVAGFSSLTPGSHVWVSATAGKLADGQAGSGYYNYIVGIAEATTTVFVRPCAESIAKQS